MLETWLSKLEEHSFGVSDFKRHSHAFTGLSRPDFGHAHKLMLRTGRPWPGQGGHRHMLDGYTVMDITGHHHQVRGWTAPSAEAGTGHTHQIDVMTLTPTASTAAHGEAQAAKVPAHKHSVSGTTTPV